MRVPLPWTANVPRRQPPPNRAGVTPLLEETFPVFSTPALFPDPPRSENIPSRRSRRRISLLGFFNRDAAEEGRFVHGHSFMYGPGAAMPHGSQLPDQYRRNVKVPPHVAYGSLFE